MEGDHGYDEAGEEENSNNGALVGVLRKRPRSEMEEHAGSSPHPSPTLAATAAPVAARPLRFERSIFGFSEIEGVLRKISDFLFLYADTPHLEVEAKIGFLIDTEAGGRLNLPITCETEVTRNNLQFNSSVPGELFRIFNEKLNERFRITQQPGYKGSKVTYARCNEVDIFYPGNVRVTLDEHGNEKRIIRKSRLKDMNFYSPQSFVDFRISASTEEATERPRTRPNRERKKERISYKFEIFSFDLTKVELNDRQGASTTYEMEVELVGIDLLRAERQKLNNKQPNEFLAIATALLNNVHAFQILSNQLKRY